MTDFSRFSIGNLTYNQKIDEKNFSPREKALYAFAEMYGLKFFCFNPNDIRQEEKIINGMFWDKDKKEFVRMETPYPDIIADPPSFRNDAPFLYDKLAEHSYLTDTFMGTKRAIVKLIESTPFAPHLIETWRFKKVVLENILQKHKTVILKPDSGVLGRGVTKVTKLEDGNYSVHAGYDVQTMTPGKFKNEYARDFKEQDYIVQPYVNSTTKEGNPFDIRIHVARGRGGKWDLVLCYALVGNKDGIVSNYTKGSGRYPNLPGFLELQFGEDWKNINKEIWRIIKTFPPELQKKRPKPIERITIDAAINRDNNNEIKFFEVDTEPNLTFWHFETAEASMHFYMYLLDMKNRSCL